MRIDLGTYASGFAMKDERYDQMKAAFWACKEAGVAVPTEVLFYFNHKTPTDDELMYVDLGDAVSYADDDSNRDCPSQTITINIAELPKNVDVIVISATAKEID